MATVSTGYFFSKPDEVGECPVCQRFRRLGHVHPSDKGEARCEDCLYGPPMAQWNGPCEKCGQRFVGEKCDNPVCPQNVPPVTNSPTRQVTVQLTMDEAAWGIVLQRCFGDGKITDLPVPVRLLFRAIATSIHKGRTPV